MKGTFKETQVFFLFLSHYAPCQGRTRIFLNKNGTKKIF